MSKENELRVWLKIIGPEDPAALSTQLGLQPTDSWRRGEPRGRWNPSYSAWVLESPIASTESLEDRIIGLLDLLAPARAALRSLPPGVEAILQVAGSWHQGFNPGVFLSAPIVVRIGQLGLGIDCDLFVMTPPPSAAVDPEADAIFGSDVERDGVYLEQRYESGGWIEVFRSDADDAWTISADILDLSLERLDNLLSNARSRLPPKGQSGEVD